jgi:predicted branched-subunit amino acid permease
MSSAESVKIENNASARAQFLAGARAHVPNLAGVIPFGLVAGAFSFSVFKDVFAAVVLPATSIAGRSQVVALTLWRDGAPIALAILAAIIVNLRLLMYAAALAPHFEHLSFRWKIFMSAIITDQPFAVCLPYLQRTRDTEAAPVRHFYLLGGTLIIWLCWVLMNLIGAWIGTTLPASLDLDFIPTLSFIPLVTSNLRNRPSVWASVIAGILAVTLAGLPWSIGLLFASVIGISVGVWADGRISYARSRGA